MLFCARIVICVSPVIAPTVSTVAPVPTVTLVFRAMRKSLSMPAPLARPPVEPFTLGVATFRESCVRSGRRGLSTLLVAKTPTLRARITALFPILASTVASTSLSTVTPAPASTPPASDVIFVFRPATCAAERSSVPVVPVPVRMMWLPAPISARVALIPEVAAFADAPAATPPLPAPVVAKLTSVPNAPTDRVLPVSCTPLPR